VEVEGSKNILDVKMEAQILHDVGLIAAIHNLAKVWVATINIKS